MLVVVVSFNSWNGSQLHLSRYWSTEHHKCCQAWFKKITRGRREVGEGKVRVGRSGQWRTPGCQWQNHGRFQIKQMWKSLGVGQRSLERRCWRGEIKWNETHRKSWLKQETLNAVEITRQLERTVSGDSLISFLHGSAELVYFWTLDTKSLNSISICSFIKQPFYWVATICTVLTEKSKQLDLCSGRT